MKYTDLLINGKLLGFLILSFVYSSCNNDDDKKETPSIKFSVSESRVNEDDGTVEIEITASKAVSTDVAVYFEVSGTASVNGDFKLEVDSPVTLKAGTKTTILTIELINDSIIESEDDLIIELTSVGEDASLSKTSSDLECVVTIEDDDSADDDKLQIDLTWNLGEGQNIDAVNLDLYLATDVVIEDNSVADANIFSASENSSGFESVSINKADKDTEYYIVVGYIKGDIEVDFTINVNGFGYTNEKISGTFKRTEVDGALFFGPLKKSGSTISRKASGLKI